MNRPKTQQSSDCKASARVMAPPTAGAISRGWTTVILAFLILSSPGPASAAELVVMTYNLRYASDQPPNAWPARRPVMKAAIERMAPDLFGTQEGLYRQLKDLAADLPVYDWIGLGRDGG